MKVTILQPVQHDGKALEVGKTVDLKADAAKALIDCGAAEKAGASEDAAAAKAPAEPAADAAADANKAAE